MTRIKNVLAVLIGLAAAGCDNGPSLKVTAEPAGVNCPTGGYRIEADGELFYSCSGQATTEEIATGAEGNPCIGPALRILVPTTEGTRYAYVCQTPDVDATSVGVLNFGLRSVVAQGRIECGCTEDPEAKAACEQQIDLYESLMRVSEGCISNVVLAVGPLPESERAAAECYLTALDEAVTCLDSIDVAECSAETEMAVTECQAMGDTSACAETTEAFNDWRDTVADVAEFLNCPLLGT